MVQAKLEVGAVDDPLEREADRVADTVMRAPVPPPAPDDRRIVRRKCNECEEADTVARKGAEGAASLDRTAAPAPVQETLAAPGRPLDLETRGAIMFPASRHMPHSPAPADPRPTMRLARSPTRQAKAPRRRA
jgi:hypothetical protein